MKYEIFAGAMLEGRDLTRLGGLERTERTLHGYYRTVDGENLTRTEMPKIKKAFWFAYESGWDNAMGKALDITLSAARKI